MELESKYCGHMVYDAYEMRLIYYSSLYLYLLLKPLQYQPNVRSELVNQFIKQTREKHKGSTIINASGKYTEQSSPFSAITEVLARLASDFTTKDEEDKPVKKGGLSYEQKAKIWNNIKQSEVIGPSTEGNRILRKTFPALIPLLDSCKKDGERETEEELDSSATRRHSIQPSMNAIKSSTSCLLSIISETLDRPLIIFLDDMQWGDAPSFDMLTFLLSSSQLKRVMFICAYRSNEVDAEHLFTTLMDDIPTEYTHKMDLFSLSPDAITCFIADSVKKEDCENEVAELAEAVYEKTMGNIFFTMQALEELVRKNILFYDMMSFEWRWVVKKVDLAEYMSNDVVESVKGKLKELPKDVQHLLVVMSYITHNSLDVVMIRVLMSSGERKFDEQAVRKVLKLATEESMLMSSVENGNYRFAHDRIRQASVEYAAEKNEDFSLPLFISKVLMDFGESPQMEWCLFNAVDLLNSLPPNKTNRSSLIDMNIRVAKISRSKGSRVKENELLHEALKSLRSSGIMWKGKHYELTLELYNAAIDSDFSLGMCV